MQKENSIQKSDASRVSKKKRKSSWMTSLRFRWISQISFFILTIYVGWMFYLFVQYCETGGASVYVTRPPGVEAFLPIGAFMGLKYFLGTGKVDPLHPAGFIMFASILVTSILFQRGFCSWICPVGTISEWAWRFGDWIKTLADGINHPGQYTVSWDATNSSGVEVSAGIYIVKLNVGNLFKSNKIVLLK